MVHAPKYWCTHLQPLAISPCYGGPLYRHSCFSPPPSSPSLAAFSLPNGVILWSMHRNADSLTCEPLAFSSCYGGPVCRHSCSSSPPLSSSMAAISLYNGVMLWFMHQHTDSLTCEPLAVLSCYRLTSPPLVQPTSFTSSSLLIPPPACRLEGSVIVTWVT